MEVIDSGEGNQSTAEQRRPLIDTLPFHALRRVHVGETGHIIPLLASATIPASRGRLSYQRTRRARYGTASML